MFTISAKGVYGLTALVELAGCYGTGPRQIKDIADAHRIPQHYLEQILVALKKSGVVESFRGASGGYALAKHPSLIGVMEALTMLEGKLEIVSEQKRDNFIGFFWNQLQESIALLLDRTIEQLFLEQQMSKQQLHYDI